MASSSIAGKAEFDAEYFKIVGENLGVSTLSSTVCEILSEELSFQLRRIVEKARKFSLHGRRTRLIAEDFDDSLKFLSFEPVLGFDQRLSYPMRFAGMADVEMFVYDDAEADLSQLLNFYPPKPPMESALRAHWLAIDGEQPALAENPTQTKEEGELSSSIAQAIVARRETAIAGSALAHLRSSMRNLRRSEDVHIRTALAHSLSVEQQKYFKDVIEACVGSDEKRRQDALHGLQTDTGLQPLLPRIAALVADGVRCNVVQRNLALLIYLMRILHAVVNNLSLNLQGVLQDVLPCVLTCMVSRQLCARPEVDNHWTLRDYAGKLLLQLCRHKEYMVCEVRQRVLQLLRSVFHDPASTHAMVYGAFYPLYELSNVSERAAIQVRFQTLCTEARLKSGDLTAPQQARVDAERLYAILSKYESAMKKCAAKHLENNSSINVSLSSS